MVDSVRRRGGGPGAKVTRSGPGEPAAGAYVEIAGARFELGSASGKIETDASQVGWELSFEHRAEPFRHLPYHFLYRAPLPRTKLLSPDPDARFSGSVTVDGERFELDGWPGMVGHNWGTEHAERWIWTQAYEFREADGWFDAGLGRIKVGPLTTPWIGNAMLCLDGEAHRLGGLDRIRSTRVDEHPTHCGFELSGKGIKVRGQVASEARDFVTWNDANPVGPEHEATAPSATSSSRSSATAMPAPAPCVRAAAYGSGCATPITGCRAAGPGRLSVALRRPRAPRAA